MVLGAGEPEGQPVAEAAGWCAPISLEAHYELVVCPFVCLPQRGRLHKARSCTLLVSVVQTEVLLCWQLGYVRCCADIASKVKVGQTEFKRYPENLLNSRVRYGRAFKVRERGFVCALAGHVILIHRMPTGKALVEGCRAVQDIADEAKGNVLIVTHGDAVNSSVSRLRPWAIVHPVHHTGFTAAYRDEKEGAGPCQPVHAYPPLSRALVPATASADCHRTPEIMFALSSCKGRLLAHV